MTRRQSSWVASLLKLKPADSPAALHRAFEAELGYINSHLCIADAALRDLEKASKADARFVHRRVRANGHRRLNVAALRLDDMLELSYASHIALLLGRLAHLCDRVGSHPLVDRKLNEVAKGDYLRRALWVVLQSQSDEQLQTPLDDVLLAQYIPQSASATFDQLRGARNIQFHSSSPSRGPSPTRFPEVLTCSKALQQISRSLCRSLAGTHLAIAEMLTKRYNHLRSDRRRHAARATLEQEYLLDSADVHGILFDLTW